MKHYYCPLSVDACHQLKELSESYRLAVAAASDYNTISLASRKQVEAAIARADRLGEVIDCYLNGWQRGIPCLLYSCGWEYCRRNLEILNCLPNLSKIMPKPPHYPHKEPPREAPKESSTDLPIETEIDYEIENEDYNIEFQIDDDSL